MLPAVGPGLPRLQAFRPKFSLPRQRLRYPLPGQRVHQTALPMVQTPLVEFSSSWKTLWMSRNFTVWTCPVRGRGVRLQAALQAHTCKPVEVAEDELFTMNHPSGGQIYMKAYDLCVAAEGPKEESLLHLEPCSDSLLQRFSFASDGRIQLEGGADARLCLSVASGPGTPTGGPSHLRLELNLQRCDDVDPPRSRWITR